MLERHLSRFRNLSVYSEACVAALCFVTRQPPGLVALRSLFLNWCKIIQLFWVYP